MSLANPLYDRTDLAATYAAVSATNVWNAAYERPAIRALCGDVAGRDVLDAGCAAGEHSAWLLDSGARVTAIDASAAMVELARTRTGGRARVLQADLAQPLALADHSIDLVLSSLTLHYLASWSATLGEFARVLRPGGRLVFSTHHPHLTIDDGAPYRTVRLVNEHWDGFGTAPVSVAFYHRSFETIFAEISASGLAVRRIVEPGATDELVARDPGAAARLNARPWFLFVVAARSA